MRQRAGQRQRPKISVTVAPELLSEVDAYTRNHAGTDRSKIIDEALRCWIVQRQREELRAQFTSQRSPEEEEERAAWRRIRAAQAKRLIAKYDANARG